MRYQKEKLNLYVPLVIKNIIDRLVDERKIPVAQFNEMVFMDGLRIVMNKGMTEEEKMCAEIYDKNMRALPFEYLRSHSAKRITFIKNIRKNLMIFHKGYIEIDIAEVIENLKMSLEIAKIYGWEREQKEVERLIRIISETKFDISEIDEIIDKLETDIRAELVNRKEAKQIGYKELEDE